MNRAAFIAFFLAGILLAGNCHAQKEKKESFEKLRSRSSQSNTERLLREADQLKDRDPKGALDKVEEAIGMSLAQGDDFNEGKSYVLLGEINEGIQEWKLALENYALAYQKLKAVYSNSAEYKRTLRGLGNSHLKLGTYHEALKYFQEALSVETSENQIKELQLDVSEVYYQMKMYDDALRVLEEITGSPKVSNSSLETRLQNERAKIYARMNELDKSQNIYQNQLNTLRSNRNIEPEAQQSLQNTKEEIAGALREQKRYDEEIDLRNRSVEFNLESDNLEEVAKDKVEISKTLSAKGEDSEALREIEEAVAITDTLDNPGEQANAYLTLADLYEKNGRTTQALSAYRKYSKAVTRKEEAEETKLLEKSELIKKQKDIEEVTKDVSIWQREYAIEQATVFRQQLIIYGLLFIILIIIVTSYFIYKGAQASKVANQMLALKSLRSQMNPHFIFNALNSVNHFIAQQDERTANQFLSEFSQLMRLVLENSQKDFIPLQKEQEILSLYLKLEHYRFRDKFDYEIKMDNDINTEGIEVPPMLIQPYIENAVWHGLRYKETKGKLTLRFINEQNRLVVEITDDGIGRKKSAELKTENQKKHNSTGLKNIQDRLAIINKVYKANYQVVIGDLESGRGTKVRIHLPVNGRMHAA